MFTNLTAIQKIGITIGIASFLAASTAQLDVLFGVAVEKMIVALLTLIAGAGGVIVANIGGSANMVKYADQKTLVGAVNQENLVKAVQAMPGIDSLVVNANATPKLAQMALDPAQGKVEIAVGASAAVQRSADRGP